MGRKPLINKKVLVSLFIVGIMVLSTFGFILSYSTSQRQKQEYNGHEFIITDVGIKTKIDEKEIYFNYFPTQLEHIEISDTLKETLKNMKMVTVTYDPNADMASAMAEVQYQAEQNIPEYRNIFVARGLTNATGYTTKQVNCEDATKKNPVLELRAGENTEIVFENNCIIAIAVTENDFFAIYERILYVILGVME